MAQPLIAEEEWLSRNGAFRNMTASVLR